MRVPKISLYAFACMGIVASFPTGAPFHFEGRVHYGGRFAPDTLIESANCTIPDDGRGPVDSLRLLFRGGIADTIVVVKPPISCAKSLKQVIPTSTYAGLGGSATYSTYVDVQIWRRGTFSTSHSNEVNITLADAAPTVTNLLFTAVKKP